MAKNGFRVFDSDMHLLEPVDLWERYIDAEFKDRAPKGLARTPLDLSVEVGGRVGPNLVGRSDTWIREEHGRLMHNYVEEAERGFAQLIQALIEADFDKRRLREDVANLCYIGADGRFWASSRIERLLDLEAVPSPYLNGRLDAFFFEA